MTSEHRDRKAADLPPDALTVRPSKTPHPNPPAAEPPPIDPPSPALKDAAGEIDDDEDGPGRRSAPNGAPLRRDSDVAFRLI